MNCVFVRINADLIRCLNCGTERITSEDPARYHRTCSIHDSAAELVLVGDTLSRLRDSCIYRGPIVEQAACNVCGMHGQPFQIYGCELHGRCMVKRFRNDRPELKVCVTCEDFACVVEHSTATMTDLGERPGQP